MRTHTPLREPHILARALEEPSYETLVRAVRTGLTMHAKGIDRNEDAKHYERYAKSAMTVAGLLPTQSQEAQLCANLAGLLTYLAYACADKKAPYEMDYFIERSGWERIYKDLTSTF